ncbi:hypothetical protein CCP2SC5_240026 [Azospirillaceae bacterium]
MAKAYITVLNALATEKTILQKKYFRRTPEKIKTPANDIET